MERKNSEKKYKICIRFFKYTFLHLYFLPFLRISYKLECTFYEVRQCYKGVSRSMSFVVNRYYKISEINACS